jgi:Glycosyltransferase 61
VLFTDSTYPLARTTLDPLWSAFGPLGETRSYAHLLASANHSAAGPLLFFDRLYLPMNAYHTLFWTQLLPRDASTTVQRELGCASSTLLDSFVRRAKRALLGAAWTCTPSTGHRSRRLTLIRRAPTAGCYHAVGRVIENERDLVATLEGGLRARGWEVHVVDLATLSAEEQARQLACTDLLVGMHGAGLVNLLWMRHGAAVLVLFPMHYHRAHFSRLARLRQLHYGEWRNTHMGAHFPRPDIAGVQHQDKQAHTRVHLDELWTEVERLVQELSTD